MIKPVLSEEVIAYQDHLALLDLKESTRQIYFFGIKKFLNNNPDIYDVEDYNDFLYEHTIKRRNLAYYSAIKNYIDFKIEDVELKYKLLRGLVKPKHQALKIVRKKLDSSTRQQIIDNIRDEKHKVIAKIQENQGVRAGDILRLKRGNISYEADGDALVMRLDLTEMKGGKRSVKFIYNLDLQLMIESYIKSHLEDYDYYFLDRRNFSNPEENSVRRANYLRYWRDLKQALAKSGVDFQDWATHDFRRNFADAAWNLKKDLLLLQRVMDHSDPSTTTRYLINSGQSSKDLSREIDEDNIDI